MTIPLVFLFVESLHKRTVKWIRNFFFVPYLFHIFPNAPYRPYMLYSKHQEYVQIAWKISITIISLYSILQLNLFLYISCIANMYFKIPFVIIQYHVWSWWRFINIWGISQETWYIIIKFLNWFLINTQIYTTIYSSPYRLPVNDVIF